MQHVHESYFPNVLGQVMKYVKDYLTMKIVFPFLETICMMWTSGWIVVAGNNLGEDLIGIINLVTEKGAVFPQVR